jgi:hypothetical protein
MGACGSYFTHFSPIAPGVGEVGRSAAISVRERVHLRLAHVLHAPPPAAPIWPVLCFLLGFFPLFFWALCCTYPCSFLCNGYSHGVRVIWILYTPLTTFNAGLDFLHQCPELSLHLQKHYPRVLTFLVFYLYFHWVTQS